MCTCVGRWDCEATQKAINDAQLGIRAVRGFTEVLYRAGLQATLYVLPSDAVAYAQLLRDLDQERFEIGLHSTRKKRVTMTTAGPIRRSSSA